MKTAGLLLASAPIWLVAGGGALAAPVDYVKICDSFGTGFYYVPGTTTCIQVGGYIRWDEKYGFSTDVWSPKGTAKITADVRTNTNYGVLKAYVAGHFNTVPEHVWDDRYLEFTGSGGAGLLAGWTGSTFDHGGGYTYEGGYHSDASPVRQVRFGTPTTNQVAFKLAIEDQRDRAIGETPAFILTVSPKSPWKLTGALAVSDTPFGFGWAVQGGAEIGVTKEFSVRTVVGFTERMPSYVGLSGASDASAWSALVTAKWAPTSTFNIAGSLSFADSSTTDPVLQASAGAYWKPIPHVALGGEFTYKGAASGGGATTFLARAQYNIIP